MQTQKQLVMKIIDNVEVTAGQLVKELEGIVINNPGAIPINVPRILDDNEEELMEGITGICTLKNGLVVLEEDTFYEEDHEKYLTAEALLTKLKGKPESSKVVLLYNAWEIRKILPVDNNGTILQCDDDGFIRLNCSESDIRLFTWLQLRDDLKRFAKKYPERKIVCWDEDDSQLYYFKSERSKGGCGESLCIETGHIPDEEDATPPEDTISVSSFIADVPEKEGCGVFVEMLNGKLYMAIARSPSGHIFFEDWCGNDEVIACRLGDIVCDTDYFCLMEE